MDGPLTASGWSKQSVPPKLAKAQIDHWQKEMDGTIANLYTGVIGRAGQATAAVETFVFLERVNPRLVFLCGIAGSLDEAKTKKTDVVVARRVHWCGHDKIQDASDVPDINFSKYRWINHPSPYFDADLVKVLERAVLRVRTKGALSLTDFNVQIGEIFTWDYVTSATGATADILRRFPQSLCVEMESGGFLEAISRYRTIRPERQTVGLVVRGISDYTIKKDNDARARTAASRNAALVCVSMAEDAFATDGSHLLELQK